MPIFRVDAVAAFAGVASSPAATVASRATLSTAVSREGGRRREGCRAMVSLYFVPARICFSAHFGGELPLSDYYDAARSRGIATMVARWQRRIRAAAAGCATM